MLCFFKYPVDNCRKESFFPPHQAAALVSQFLYRGKRYRLPSLIIAKPKVGGCGPPCDPSWSPPEVTELQCSPAWLFSPGRLAMTGHDWPTLSPKDPTDRGAGSPSTADA